MHLGRSQLGRRRWDHNPAYRINGDFRLRPVVATSIARLGADLCESFLLTVYLFGGSAAIQTVTIRGQNTKDLSQLGVGLFPPREST